MQLQRWYLAPVLGLTLVHLAPGCGGGEVIVGGEGGNGGDAGSSSSSSSPSSTASGTTVSSSGDASSSSTGQATTTASASSSASTADSSSASTTTSSSVSTTASSSVSASSSSSGGNPTPDVCNDLTLTLVNGAAQSVQGDTTGLTGDYSISCADPAGAAPDAVVNVNIAEECILNVTLITQGFDAGIAAFGGTCQPPAIGCANVGAQQDAVIDVFPPGNYSFVVDGSDGASGPFSLTFLCEEPVCGDGFVTTGEQCDVTPPVPMDGCGDPGAPNECQFEVVDAGVENCAEADTGAPIAIATNTVLHIPSMPPYRTTIGAVDDFTSTDPACVGVGPGGRDHVYRVVPAANGVLTARVGENENDQAFCDVGPLAGCWDRMIYAREATCLGGTNVACSDDLLDGGAVEEVSFAVVGGQPYYIIVDGSEAVAQGLYVLRLELE